MLTPEQIETMRKIQRGANSDEIRDIAPDWVWEWAPVGCAVRLTEAGAEVLRFHEELQSERRRNVAIEEEGGAESILSDLGALLDARVGWFEGEGAVDHVRRALDERDALRAALEEARLVLAAEQGRQEGAPNLAWSPRGGLLLHWSREYPDGSSGRTRRLEDGTVEWERLLLGLLSGYEEDADGDRPPSVIASGVVPHFRAAMQAADGAIPTAA